ncbi:hypothetical protein GCM10028819_42170 [Spirosoma humi]
MDRAESKIEEWLLDAIVKTDLEGIALDRHIDQFGIYQPTNKTELFEKACSVINLVASILTQEDTRNLGIYLHIDLISDSTMLSGAPRSIDELLDLVEEHSIPEIVIYKPVESADVPLNEFYRTTLPFKLLNLHSQLIAIYKEYRSGFSISEEYQRELNIIFRVSSLA